MSAGATAGADPSVTVELIRRHATDLRRYADGIEAALATTARVNGSLATAWADAAGREWSDRLQAVHRELARQADAAGELVRAAERAVADLLGVVGGRLGDRTRYGDHRRTGSPQSPDLGAPYPADHGPGDRGPGGVRLGELDATRVGTGHGVVVPTLPEPGG